MRQISCTLSRFSAAMVTQASSFCRFLCASWSVACSARCCSSTSSMFFCISPNSALLAFLAVTSFRLTCTDSRSIFRASITSSRWLRWGSTSSSSVSWCRPQTSSHEVSLPPSLAALLLSCWSTASIRSASAATLSCSWTKSSCLMSSSPASARSFALIVSSWTPIFLERSSISLMRLSKLSTCCSTACTVPCSPSLSVRIVFSCSPCALIALTRRSTTL
mmetsp:Transcript_38075/g.107602  ORF Transcript_38075/g.107602 Transcript_38075/m.107602 type:complete len:220 (-) Transcript_38075:228-887(-)